MCIRDSGTGPRYCPSIEDKIVKFADKDRHQVFLEPEGMARREWYVQGMSTSLPEDVQWEMYRSVPGLARAELTRLAYAIEYDCIDSRELRPTLETVSYTHLRHRASGWAHCTSFSCWCVLRY